MMMHQPPHTLDVHARVRRLVGVRCMHGCTILYYLHGAHGGRSLLQLCRGLHAAAVRRINQVHAC